VYVLRLNYADRPLGPAAGVPVKIDGATYYMDGGGAVRARARIHRK